MTKYDEIFIDLPAGKSGINKPDTIIWHASSEWVYDTLTKKWFHVFDFWKINNWSVHYSILPWGGIVTHKSIFDIAYHAQNNNFNTIGIECILGGFNPYERFVERIKNDWVMPEQIKSGHKLIKRIKEQAHIKTITTHHLVDPLRKPDPGEGFPLEEFTEVNFKGYIKD